MWHLSQRSRLNILKNCRTYRNAKSDFTFDESCLNFNTKIVSEYDQEIHNHKLQTNVIVRKSHTTITRHQEDKQSIVISSLLPIKMIAKLEWIQSNVQQNIEQLQNNTMGVT